VRVWFEGWLGAGRSAPAQASPRWQVGYAKSRPGMTPCDLIRDCRFPSSAATIKQQACGAKVPPARKEPPRDRRGLVQISGLTDS
jgi:hypothetical protein